MYFTRITTLIFAAVCILSVFSHAETLAEPRQKIAINSVWSFALEDSLLEQGEENKTGEWQTVDLPHTWNANDSRDKRTPYHRGVGFYRKTLFIAPALANKKLYLYFEGANQIAAVSVNDKPAGRHSGGYSAFAFDISDLVAFGKRNDIEVRVDNRHNDNVPPLNADFTFYGGIYRDVWLLVLDDVHFDLDSYAATDLHIRPVSVSAAQATISIEAGLANASATERKVEVDSSIVNAEGAVLARESVTTLLGAGEVSKQRLATFKIKEPKLWSPESPYLYRVICTIRDGEHILDKLQYPLGLRWFEFDAQTGFRLNGKPYRLFGTNRHQDYPGRGNALPDKLHRSDLQKIKNNGFNFLRLAHYPQDPAVLEAADDIGLLIWEEIPIVNRIGLSAAFRQTSTRMVKEMIRQHRHHPSVIFWGYMNEVMLRKPEPPPKNYDAEVVALANHLNAVAKQEDPLRPTVMAMSYDELGNGVPLQTIPDILALNLYFGWYYGKFESLGEFLDDYRQRNPEVPLLVSEYGAGGDERVHAPQPVSFDFSTEYQQLFHEASFRQILDRPWLIGSAVWNQFDFGSNHREDTKFAINQKGLWYFDRTPKDIAYFYQAHLSQERVLHIAARDWQRRAGSRPDDALQPVRVYSNESPLELFVNGDSLGSKAVRNATSVWDVRFAAGKNNLLARSATREDALNIYYEERSSLFSEDPALAALIAINAGGNEQVITQDKRIWEADRAYVKGSWGYLGGKAERSHRRIFNTDDDPLYQTRRLGSHSYQFDVADGSYLLTLHLARLTDKGRDTDGFRIDVNGLTAEISNPAPDTRREIEMLVAAAGGKGLTLRFSSGAVDAFINGIVLQRADSGSTLKTDTIRP